MNITVIHTASPELLEAIRGLFGGKAGISHKKPEPAESKGESAAPTTSAVTTEQVRSAVQGKAQAGKKDAVKALLATFNAGKVTDLATEKYADFLEKINAL